MQDLPETRKTLKLDPSKKRSSETSSNPTDSPRASLRGGAYRYTPDRAKRDGSAWAQAADRDTGAMRLSGFRNDSDKPKRPKRAGAGPGKRKGPPGGARRRGPGGPNKPRDPNAQPFRAERGNRGPIERGNSAPRERGNGGEFDGNRDLPPRTPRERGPRRDGPRPPRDGQQPRDFNSHSAPPRLPSGPIMDDENFGNRAVDDNVGNRIDHPRGPRPPHRPHEPRGDAPHGRNRRRQRNKPLRGPSPESAGNGNGAPDHRRDRQRPPRPPQDANAETNAAPLPPSPPERLQKVLARAGFGSRRSLEEEIAAGAVLINGTAAELGATVQPGDVVEIEGQRLVARTIRPFPPRLLIYNKPEGEICTSDDPEGRPTVFEKLPRLKNARWIAVGRLDINTAGLLLFTDSGELAHALMHPSFEIEREYVCRVHGELAAEVPERLLAGVELDDGPAKFSELHAMNELNSNQWYRVVIKEGRQREVRRLWEAVGVQVSRLKRIRYGEVSLPRGVKRGGFQRLKEFPSAWRELIELPTMALEDPDRQPAAQPDGQPGDRPRHGRRRRFKRRHPRPTPETV
jgi:pseudouridine synthase